jgi:hypothetical protein
MSEKSKIKNFFSHIDNDMAIEVVILEDNKYKIGNTLKFPNLDFFADIMSSEMKKGDFVISGGDDREFYISNGDLEYTFQVRIFEFDDSIDLEV